MKGFWRRVMVQYGMQHVNAVCFVIRKQKKLYVGMK